MSPHGGPKGAGVQLACAVFEPLQLKNGNFRNLFFFCVITIINGKIYVRYVLDPIHVLFTLFGCLDGGKGLGHNMLMQFFTLGSSKMDIFNNFLFGCSDHL